MILRRLPARRWIGVIGLLIAVDIGIAVEMTVSNAAEPPAAKSAARGPQRLVKGDPQAHGLTVADLNALRAILRTAIDDRTVPGVSLLLAHKGEIIFKEAFGNLTVDQKALHGVELEAGDRDSGHDSGRPGEAVARRPGREVLARVQRNHDQGQTPKKPPTVRHLLCNMSGLPGDFLAESLLKRMRKGAGKTQDDMKAMEDEKAPSASNGRLLAGKRSLADSVRELAKGGLVTEPGCRVSLLHHGLQRGGPGRRSRGQTAVRRTEPNRTVRADGHEQHPLYAAGLAGAGMLDRRSPTARAGSSWPAAA